jgi:hypothetical protein
LKTKIEIRRFQPGDYETIVRRDFDEITYAALRALTGTAQHLATSGPAFTIVAGDEIMACGGVVKFWEGVGEAWMMGSPLIERYKISFAKRAARLLNWVANDLHLVRLQTVVDAEHTVARTWVERMGFINEGTMKRYLAGRDFIRYARLEG